MVAQSYQSIFHSRGQTIRILFLGLHANSHQGLFMVIALLVSMKWFQFIF